MIGMHPTAFSTCLPKGSANWPWKQLCFASSSMSLSFYYLGRSADFLELVTAFWPSDRGALWRIRSLRMVVRGEHGTNDHHSYTLLSSKRDSGKSKNQRPSSRLNNLEGQNSACSLLTQYSPLQGSSYHFSCL